MGSYKQMLRDRMPATMSLALKWCKAKNRWIDYVYDRWIKKVPKCEKSNTVKYVLGLLPAYKLDDIKATFAMFGMTLKKPIPDEEMYLRFNETIDLSTNGEDVEYWKYVISWVTWFKRIIAFIENHYVISKKQGDTDEEIKNFIKTHYCNFLDEQWNEKLTNYIMDYLKNDVLCISRIFIVSCTRARNDLTRQ